MLHFFYDSLDTLKKVKKPTWKEIRMFTIQVFLAVIIWSILFFVLDNIWGNVYKQIFQTFGSSQAPVVEQQEAPLTIPEVDQPQNQEPAPSDEAAPVVGTGVE